MEKRRERVVTISAETSRKNIRDVLGEVDTIAVSGKFLSRIINRAPTPTNKKPTRVKLPQEQFPTPRASKNFERRRNS